MPECRLADWVLSPALSVVVVGVLGLLEGVEGWLDRVGADGRLAALADGGHELAILEEAAVLLL